jgi:hypothetical protein
MLQPRFMLLNKALGNQMKKAALTSNISPLSYIVIDQATRDFGIIQEYNDRKNKKLINNLLVNEENKFWVTSSRPSNFGDPLDTKTKVDNWFDENR